MFEKADYEQLEKEAASVMAEHLTYDQIILMTEYDRLLPGKRGLKAKTRISKAANEIWAKEVERVYKEARGSVD